MFPVEIIRLSPDSRHETKHLAVNVRLMRFLQFLADMASHTVNIVLKQFHILEHLMIDTLQDVVACLRVCSLDLISLVNQSSCQRNNFFNLSNLRKL